MFDKKESNKNYYIKNREKLKEYQKQYYSKNKKEIYNKRKEYKEQWNKNNPEYNHQYTIKWKKDNPEYYKKYYKNKRKKDLKYNLNHKISTAIGLSLRGNKNGRHWETLVGYTLNELIKYLKNIIPTDYNWQDYINGRLHIDHIIPISVFNFTEPEHIDFKRCWALGNLRLLPAKENLIKHNKLSKPFQPALAI